MDVDEIETLSQSLLASGSNEEWGDALAFRHITFPRGPRGLARVANTSTARRERQAERVLTDHRHLGTQTPPTEVIHMPAYRGDPEPVNDEDLRLTRPVMDNLARGHTRRTALRLLAVGALAAPVVVRSPSARAIRGWCRRDPIVKIGDLTVHIVLSSDAQMHELATGPTQLVITVPAGIATRHVADDPGFGHFGYDVRFAESGELKVEGRSFDVQIKAYAPAAEPAAGPLPLVLELTPRGGGRPTTGRAEGRANEWITLRANLDMKAISKQENGRSKKTST